MYCPPKMQHTHNNWSVQNFIPMMSDIPDNIKILNIDQIHIPHGTVFPKLPNSIKEINFNDNIYVDRTPMIRRDWTSAQLRDFLKVVLGVNKGITVYIKNDIHMLGETPEDF